MANTKVSSKTDRIATPRHAFFSPRGLSAYSDDEIELFNRSDFAVDLVGWTIADSQFPADQIGNLWVIQTGVVIEANGYLVLAKENGYTNFALDLDALAADNSIAMRSFGGSSTGPRWSAVCAVPLSWRGPPPKRYNIE